jgi:hypothetical protein
VLILKIKKYFNILYSKKYLKKWKVFHGIDIDIDENTSMVLIWIIKYMTICSLIHQAIEVTRLLAAFILKYSLDGSNLKKKNWLKKVYIYILKNGDTDAQLKKKK